MALTHVRTRIAPSPTGVPHIGNTRTALFDYLLAKKYHGEFILRIEDTDRNRFVEGSIEKIYQIMEDLNLHPDESPLSPGGYGPYIQSERLDKYKKYAQQLVDIGAAYLCFCTEERLKKLHEADPYAKYDRHCRNLSPGEIRDNLANNVPHVVRVKLPEDGYTVWNDLVQGKLSLPNAECDDKILLKTSGIPTYHLASVVDDHLMKISHVLRGAEWLMSTPVHLFLYRALDWQPPVLAHVPLLLGPDKSKLSKRHGAKSVLEYISDGYLPEAINNFLFYLGFSYKDNSDLLDLHQMTQVFDENRIQRQNAIFDIEKLNYLNGQWIRKIGQHELFNRLKSFLPQDWLKQTDKINKIIPLVRDRMTTLADFVSLSEYFFSSPNVTREMILEQSGHDWKITSNWLKQVHDNLSNESDFSNNILHAGLAALQNDSDLSTRQAFMSLRLAVTGRPVTPPLFDVLVVLGKQETLDRLKPFL